MADIELIRNLRSATGAGIMQCQKALTEAQGDFNRAVDILKQEGIAFAQQKSTQLATQGVVDCYIHAGGRIGVLVEINCETDFVARTSEFKELAHNIAMQIAAMNPRYISPSEAGGDNASPEECLLLQPFIRNPGQSIQDLLSEAIAKLGENIRIRRFTRFELGS